MAVSDAFVGCWNAKFLYDQVRPVTYIRRLIDPKWEPLLITPPFPELPSGHATQTGAAATVMTQLFGEGFAFTDETDRSDGLPPRSFPSFWAAAEEAACRGFTAESISRPSSEPRGPACNTGSDDASVAHVERCP